MGAFISGSVTSFGDASGDVTLQLIPEGGSVAAYETVVRGNTANYSFSDVAAGTYTLKVSKANHTTSEYTVIVGNNSFIQNVELWLFGDCNVDGTINAKDAVLLAQRLAGWDVSPNLATSDCNNDGDINAKDAVLLAQYLANWDVTFGGKS